MSIVTGRGTRREPFNWPVRVIIKLLLESPRRTVNSIQKELIAYRRNHNITGGDKENKGNGKLVPNDLYEGALADVLRWRIDISQLKYDGGAGTSFVSVKLKNPTRENCDFFEKEIFDVDGVIEWDQVSGFEIDYLVRVAGPVSSDRAFEVKECIGRIKYVQSSVMSEKVTILKSGVVDNYGPDDFLEIKETPI